MKKLLASILIAVSLAGCTTGGVLNVNKPVPAGTTQTPLQVAQAGVLQSQAVLAAVATTVLQNYNDKVIDKPTKDSYTNTIVKAQGYLDTAHSATNVNDVNSQVALANALIAQLQQELAKLAAQQQGTK